MSNLYIGFRVEIASRLLPAKSDEVVNTYNAQGSYLIKDLQKNGRITVNKSAGMISASGGEDKNQPGRYGAMVNFAVMTPMGSTQELERIVQIINVLGNGRLIRERVKTFTDGDSTLNNLPELQELRDALTMMDQYIPGFINGGWYYAPEAIFECKKK